MNLLELPDLPLVFLKPGELHFADQPTIVTTILGSCVSVVMYNRRLAIGAICHALLPSGSCGDRNGARYVECAVTHMLEMFAGRGVSLQEIQTKLFGGADILPALSGKSVTVGQQNILMAQRSLKGLGLQVMASSVGGSSGRKLYFFTHTGEVFLHHQRGAGESG